MARIPENAHVSSLRLCKALVLRRGLAGGGAVCGGAQLLCALPGAQRAAAAPAAPLERPVLLVAAQLVRTSVFFFI